MNQEYQKLKNCLINIRKITDFVPETVLILGSGLGDFAERIKIEKTVYYNEIDGFPVSTVTGHKGCFVFGYFEDKPIAIMNGRVHYYEGYDMADVVLPVRLLREMGAKKLIITNAAGGINPDFKPGDLMLITDQISSFVPSPLRGPNIDELGVRFPDMSSIYSKRLSDIIRKAAMEENIFLKEGIYIQTAGPNYESPAEIRMYKTLGADAVGMSTACEAIAATHAGYEVCGISCISNLAAGISKNPLTHEEVKETGRLVAEKFARLIEKILHFC